ncbi:MAG: type II toxin-antitoxin system VapC family toxin [Opitutaceae bacterium]
MLLDTTFFIDLADEKQSRHPGPAQTFLRIHRHVPHQVSVVTIGEFAVGAEAAFVRHFFRGFQPRALGRELAIYAGRLQARLPFELGENDLWIAATASYYGLPLVSRDKVFAGVSGLKVLTY